MKLKDFNIFCFNLGFSVQHLEPFFQGFFFFFFCLYTPKYCLILLKVWPEVVPIKTNTVFGKSFKILSFGSNRTHPKFTVLVHFGVQFTNGRKPKILLNIKIFAKTVSLAISHNLSLRLQKNHRILVKSSKKAFFGLKFGLNCDHQAAQKSHQKFSHSL